MSWIKRLYDTYEYNKSMIGDDSQMTVPLLPICHVTVTSHIEVVIDEIGNYLRSSLVSADESQTIIPCTEESAGRSGKYPSPHPLSDKLQYLAGDYPEYGGSKWHGYEKYIGILEKWACSESAPRKIKAIHQYEKKGDLISDLVKSGIIQIDVNGKMNEKWDKSIYKNAPNINQEDSVIRWRVEEVGVLERRAWKDQELFQAWERFYLGSLNNHGFCQVLGIYAPLAENHPKNIYNMTANAKLISSNDKNGYTYRGRFTEPEETYGVSYEASQKAHSALKWLISKQGYNRQEKSILCWTTSNRDILNLYDDDFGIPDFPDNENVHSDTGEYYASNFNMKLAGYKSKFKGDEEVNIIELESVTNGRLSITYYQELTHQDFISRVEKWHENCKWLHKYRPQKSKDNDQLINVTFVGAPSPQNIAETVYGTSKNVDPDLITKTVDRILACILEDRKIPPDLVTMAFNRTINRPAFEKNWQFDKSLSITCSLIKKYLFDYKKEVIDMALDTSRTTRDYLYGRLLAVAQNVEQWALSKSGESRLTNADRLMQRFASHPFTTWTAIELSLRPYFDRLKGGAAESRLAMVDNIMSLFDPDDFTDDHKLTGEFLLGYHSQRADLMAKRQSQNEQIDSENDLEEEE